jgi:serine/threonine protein kinase
VAIKAVIRGKLTAKLLENLESEIAILKRITHRNIVELKDCLVSCPFFSILARSAPHPVAIPS